MINRMKCLLTTSSTALLITLCGCAYSSELPPAASTNSAAAVKPQTTQTNNDGDVRPLFGGGSAKVEEISDVQMGYVKVNALPKGEEQVNPVRLQALHETALSLGATGALAWRSEQVNASLEKNSKQINQIFDFNQLLLKDNIIPPVLVESDNNLNLSSSDAIRLSAKTYQLISPARFATTAPSWRTYLWMGYKKPTVPDRSLLPRNRAEANIWNRSIKQGWEQGIRQANSIFGSNLNRLRRDYNGMILYRKLLAQGMVSAPFVAKADLGVTGDSNEIHIDDRVLRITSHSELQTDSSKWKPILTPSQP